MPAAAALSLYSFAKFLRRLVLAGVRGPGGSFS
jgi:hypothetical protein